MCFRNRNIRYAEKLRHLAFSKNYVHNCVVVVDVTVTVIVILLLLLFKPVATEFYLIPQ